MTGSRLPLGRITSDLMGCSPPQATLLRWRWEGGSRVRPYLPFHHRLLLRAEAHGDETTAPCHLHACARCVLRRSHGEKQEGIVDEGRRAGASAVFLSLARLAMESTSHRGAGRPCRREREGAPRASPVRRLCVACASPVRRLSIPGALAPMECQRRFSRCFARSRLRCGRLAPHRADTAS